MKKTNSRGQFITLEGIEGVGKSTQIKFIQHYLEEKGLKTLATHEPGGTPLANAIRNLLLTTHNEVTEKMTQTSELLLLFAARSQHITQVIEPALARGEWVVCDRFTDASYAYQGYGRGVPLAQISILEQWVQGDLHPNWVFLFDAPVEVALQRVKHRGGKPDRIESEKAEFFQRVREGYLARAKQFPERYKIIDASKPLDKVQLQLREVLKELINK